MEQKQIETKVIEILSCIMDLNNIVISNKSTLKQLGADSLDQHDFLMEIEKEFEINYSSLEDAFANNMNIEGLCQYIENAITLKETQI